jgi:hypothetical protein
MPKLKLGDRISVRLYGSNVVGPYSDYTEIRTFDIIGLDYERYYLYVPPYVNLSNTIKIDKYNCKSLGIDSRFIGEEALLIQENRIYKIVSSLDGMFCDSCKEFYDYAQPNHGAILICWSCRQNPCR